MSVFATLAEKPWLTAGPGADRRPDAAECDGWDKGVGLGVFLAVVTVLFTLITSAYLMRMGLHSGILGHAGTDWYPLGEPPLLWFNTAILAASSLAFHWAFGAAQAGKGGTLRAEIALGGLLGLAFLIGQYALWRHYDQSGYVLASSLAVCTAGAFDPLALPIPESRSGNPAIAFFYLISGVHGLHILGGLVAWGVTARRVLGGGAPRAAARAVQLCARYWHFMLLVWLAMLALFAAT